MAWSIDDVANLTGKVIIITGASAGLGVEATKALASKGAEVILAVRTTSKGETVAQQIRAMHPDAKLHVMALNLADLSSITAFAEAFKAQFNRLDVLMNNAGVMATPQAKTADGFELQFGTNHLGHFALTGQLLDLLLNTPYSRIVNVSSIAAENGKMHFDDIMFEQEYRRFDVYSQSKLANLLFTLGLQKRLAEMDTSTIAVAAHPGVANTELSRGMFGDNILQSVAKWISSFFIATADNGAQSQLRASVDTNVQGGEYYGPRNSSKGDPVKIAMPASVHEDDIEKLWALSEQLTGVRYG
jgi:NAD(P)-dependent dehydrogenase (short-subunit alcohol dehydrogenase family)